MKHLCDESLGYDGQLFGTSMPMKTDTPNPSAKTCLSRPWTAVLLGVFVFTPSCLCCWFVGIPIFCSYQLRLPPPDVDLAPFRDLKWTTDNNRVADILNLDVLDEFDQVAGDHWISGSLYSSTSSSHYANVTVLSRRAGPPRARSGSKF